jgi:glycosyltransferase involved in cell wall biosynthesis
VSTIATNTGPQQRSEARVGARERLKSVSRPLAHGIEPRLFTLYRHALYLKSRPIGADFAQRSCLVIAPHPDDEVLGCGMAIAAKARAGSPVRVVIVTNGRNSHRSALIPPDQLVYTRRKESTEACRRLGIAPDAVEFFDVEDGAVADHAAGVAERLRLIIESFGPQDILSPSPIDRHPDHRALGALVRTLVASLPRRPRLLEYPVWFFGARAWGDWERPHRVLTGPLREFARLRPRTFAAPDLMKTKASALAAHRTQTTNYTGEKSWFTLDPAFLRHFAGKRELYFEPAGFEEGSCHGAAALRRSVPATSRPATPATRPLRVLHTLPDLATGGGQHLLLRTIQCAGPSLQHFVAVAGEDRAMEPHFRRAGATICFLNATTPWRIPAAAARLAAIVRREHVDLIHTNNTGIDRLLGQLAALLTRRPLVNTVHSQHEPPPAPRGLEARTRSTLRAARGALETTLGRLTTDRAVCVSQRAHDTWAPRLRRLGLHNGHARVLHPGLDLARFAPQSPEQIAATRRALNVGDASPILICISRLVPGKGQRLLIPALKTVLRTHPRATLMLVGDGPDRATFEQLAKDAAIASHVRFLGTRDDIPDLLAAADIALCPSYSEGFGLTLIEAMAAGTPVIATRIPSFEEILSKYPTPVATLAEPGNAESIAEAVLDLLANRSAAQSAASAARALAFDHFDHSTFAAGLTSVYRELARG